MDVRDRRWLRQELDDCVAYWQEVVEAVGPRTQTALLSRGKADELFRVAIHFGIADPEEARQRMGAPRAAGEPA